MDTESQKLFDEIVAKEPAALSPADAQFLRARRSYLNGEQCEIFADILEEAEAPKGPYDGMNVNELKALVAERKIETTATKKAELIAVLTAADAAAAQ